MLMRIACVLMISAAGCASDDVADISALEAGGGAGLIGPGELSELQTKVASLEIENQTLRRRVADLVARIARQDAVKPDEGDTDAAVASAAGPAMAIPPAPTPAAPVISAPDPGLDLPRDQAPVEAAPRLVQPTFASAETVFENEANAEELSLASILWGVHLDSYSRETFAKDGWRRLQRTFPDELGLLEPRTETVEIEGRGEIFRLIGGGFASEDTAKALCKALTAKSQYCRVVTFTGKRLSLAANE